MGVCARIALAVGVALPAAMVFAQEAPPKVVFFTNGSPPSRTGEGGFSGEIVEGTDDLGYLDANEYRASFLSFDLRHALKAVPSDRSIGSGEFADSRFGYGTTRFFLVRTSAGRAVIEEASGEIGVCAIRGKKRV